MNANETASKLRKFAFLTMVVTLLGLILTACGGSATALTVPAGAKPGELTSSRARSRRMKLSMKPTAVRWSCRRTGPRPIHA